MQSTFEERQLEYLNNYELVSASISPLNNEVDFTYSSNLRHNTKIQINTLYNQSVYSNGLISTLSSNSTIYTYSLGDYGCNNEFTLPDNSYQKSILQLGSNNDFVGYFARICEIYFIIKWAY